MIKLSEKFPLVSVIIPAYNREKTIEKSVKSVLEQTYQNIELIVIDDCSTDNTYNVVKNIKDDRLKLIRLEKNSGAQVARNQGIIESKGEWVAFLDSDDLWKVDKLALQLNCIKEINFNPYYVVHSDCDCLDITTNKKWQWKLPKTEGKCFIDLLTRPAPMFQSLFVSKEALLKIDLLDINVPSYQEWDTCISLSKICDFIHIRKPLFTYVFHEGEKISKNKSKDLEGYWYIVNKFKDEMEKYGLYRKHLKTLILRSLEFGFPDKTSYFMDLYGIDNVRKTIVEFYSKHRTKLIHNFVLKNFLRIIL